MPATDMAQSLLATARRLCPDSGEDEPSQCDLRRAASTAYYAVFHRLAAMCADALIGSIRESRPNKAWVEVYRGLDHGTAKDACEAARNVEFPVAILNFANEFKSLQVTRHQADYDPLWRADRLNVVGLITTAQECIEQIGNVSAIDQRAFAAWVLITAKGSKDARAQEKRRRDERRMNRNS